MAYKIVVGKSAVLDIEHALDWYAQESRLALEKFLTGLYQRFDEISVAPESFGILRKRPKFRKSKIRRYPYYIIFRIDDNRKHIFIAALVHEKRNPEVWIKRLR